VGNVNRNNFIEDDNGVDINTQVMMMAGKKKKKLPIILKLILSIGSSKMKQEMPFSLEVGF